MYTRAADLGRDLINTRSPAHTDDALAEVRRRIHAEAAPSQAYVVMNALAAVVASYGLLLNSTAVVIGAMVMALLLGPIMGVALGLVDGDNALVRRAVSTEMMGAVLVLSLAYGIGLLHPDIPIGSEILSRTKPNLMDEIVAVAGGTAAAYALLVPRVSSGLVGVAIATALVPPLSVCGLMLARGENQLAAGAALLYLANFVAIQVATSVVMWGHGLHLVVPKGARRDVTGTFLRNAISFITLGALSGILAVNLVQSVARERFSVQLRDAVSEEIRARPTMELVGYEHDEVDGTLRLRITVRSVVQPSYDQALALQVAIATRLQRPTAIRLNIIPTRELDPLVPPTHTATHTATHTPMPIPSRTSTVPPRATTTPSTTPTSTVVAPPITFRQPGG